MKKQGKKIVKGLAGMLVDSAYDKLNGPSDRSTATMAGIGALALMGYAAVSMFLSKKRIEKNGY